MSLSTRWRAFRKERRQKADAKQEARQAPLREFVYLDAVSLQSLLVSQNMTIPESVSLAAQRGTEAEVSSSLSADALVGKGEVAARYQATSSSTQESSRRALIQSVFKEFRELALGFRLTGVAELPEPAGSVGELIAIDDEALVVPHAALVRGDLVEIEVSLAVDPVYKLAAMMTEYSAMADEFPQMFGSHHGVLGFIRDSQPVVKVLQRFLAGLIPIRATAIDYVSIDVEGCEYLVHRRLVEDLPVATRPLRVVGVTEQRNFWKDVRRILFADSRYRVLGRVSRPGVHASWTPVKLADLFSDVAPDLVDQINAIDVPSASEATAPTGQAGPLVTALKHYRDDLLSSSVRGASSWPPEGDLLLQMFAESADTAAAQREAFDHVRALVHRAADVTSVSPGSDLAARQDARRRAGLVLFPALPGLQGSTSGDGAAASSRPDERFLDIEIVAVYW